MIFIVKIVISIDCFLYFCKYFNVQNEALGTIDESAKDTEKVLSKADEEVQNAGKCDQTIFFVNLFWIL